MNYELILYSLLVFIFGASCGSFLNVVIFRIPKGLEIFKKSSHCPHCKTPLSPFELIPIFSYFLLLGKCQTCKKPISIQYPIVEISTAGLFLVSFIFWQQNFGIKAEFLPQLFHQFFIISVLICVFAIDLKHGIIPDSIIKVAILGSIIFILTVFLTQTFATFLKLKFDPAGFGPYLIQAGFLTSLAKSFGLDLGNRLISALGVSLFFASLILVTKGRGMGFGDVKLGFWLGFVFSAPLIFQVLFLSFVTGALVAIFLIILKKKKFGESLPFGPFLAIGAIISLFLDYNLLDWYLKTLK